MSKIETYSFKSETTIEDHPDSAGVLSGWVTRFGVLSCDRGGYRDTFTANAFANITTDDVWGLWDHDWAKRFSRTSTGSLQLLLSGEGLQFRMIVPNTQAGRDAIVEYKHGLCDGCSFGYQPDEYTWSDGEDMPVRQHTSGKLVEISVVYDPAFAGTEVVLSSKTPASEESLKSLEAYKASKIVVPRTPKLDLSKQKLRIALI